MNLLDDIALGMVVGVDSAPLIYFVEGHAKYGPIIRPLFLDRLAAGLNEGVASAAALAEVLVRPLAQKRPDLVIRYRDTLTATDHMTLVDVTRLVAERAADAGPEAR